MHELLEKFKIDPDTLNDLEKETLDKWQKALAVQQLHIPDVKAYIDTMIESLEREITSFDNAPSTFAGIFFRRKKNRFALARLRNYVLLRDFLTSPEKARSYVEKQLSGFKKS